MHDFHDLRIFFRISRECIEPTPTGGSIIEAVPLLNYIFLVLKLHFISLSLLFFPLVVQAVAYNHRVQSRDSTKSLQVCECVCADTKCIYVTQCFFYRYIL